MKSDNPKTCMTDGSPIEPDHREINPKTGMQKGYVVLCPEERAKGFIRPVRQTYVHVGRVVCGKIRRDEAYEREGKVWVCVLSPGHEGECSHWATVPIDNAAKVEATHQLGGCGTKTTMGLALAETYARDPKFYGGTFCCECGAHFPVAEFTWEPDGTVVGS